MNRYGQCWSLRLLLLLMLAGVVVCEDQASRSPDQVDPDVAGLRSSFDDVFGSSEGNALRDGRTFGHKRIQFMMMPMIYKMGVMMTMMAVLTVLSLKGLLIGLILLVLKLSTIFGKLYASWHIHDHGHGHSPAGWTPPQPVHVHVHNSGGHDAHGHGPAQAYSGWEGAAGGGPPTPDESYYYKG